jgi:hypothetical protein
MFPISRALCLGCLLIFTLAAEAFAQEQTNKPQADGSQSFAKQSDPDANGQKRKPSSNHIFWVIANYREDETGTFKPLTAGARFKMSFLDSFDPSAFLVAGVFAGTFDGPESILVWSRRSGIRENITAVPLPIKRSGTS